jgi:hypothetical protein
LLPAERPIGRVGVAPTGDRRLSRCTEFSGRQGYADKGIGSDCIILDDIRLGVGIVCRQTAAGSDLERRCLRCLNLKWAPDTSDPRCRAFAPTISAA